MMSSQTLKNKTTTRMGDVSKAILIGSLIHIRIADADTS